MSTIFTLIGLVFYVGNVNARSGSSHVEESTVYCYNQQGHLISCPGSKVVGIVLGSLCGAFVVVVIIVSVIDWFSRRKKMRRNAESSGDLEASTVRKPKRSWFLWPIPQMCSKYRRVPNPVDTPNTAVHVASGANDGEDSVKHGLRHEKSKGSAPPSPASEVSIPLPPYESTAPMPYLESTVYSLPTSMPPR